MQRWWRALEQWLRVEEPGARLDRDEQKVAKTALLERLESLYDVGAPAAFQALKLWPPLVDPVV